jgi:AcrR family transcriptional regulator
MRQRAATQDATRERIVAAALDAYGEHGVRGTSMLEVARRAGVAHGTVTNHFATPDALTRAVIAGLIEEIEIPAVSVLDGAAGLDDRIDRFVTALFACYERGTAWYDLFRNELGQVPALVDGEAQFWALIGPLYPAAFGGLLDDERFRAAVFGLTSPGSLSSLTEAGSTLDDATRLVVLALQGWARVVEAAGHDTARGS